MLKIHRLAKRFGSVEAVREASFALKKGTITGFLGENGAGKTTTLKMGLGFLKPDSGRIECKARRIGYVPENPAFFPWLKGRELLGLTAGFRSLGKGVLIDSLPVLSDMCRFDASLLEISPWRYSSGNRKKFAYLQTLVVGPDLLVVDEPFAALDPPSIRATRELLLEMKRWRATILLSSHLLAEMEKICDEFIFIRKGRTVLQSDLGGLMDRSLRGTGRGLERAFMNLAESS